MDSKLRQSVIRTYYTLIDKNEIVGACNLFSDDVSYLRNAYQIEGKSKLLHFYLKERELQGSHYLSSIIENADHSIEVKGHFVGKEDKRDINFPFSDTFYFDSNNKIEKRITVY